MYDVPFQILEEQFKVRFAARLALSCFAAGSSLFISITPLVADEPVGKAVLYTTPQQQCGVMMGGIGSGFMELWPDGCFHDWSIFNRGPWAYKRVFRNVDKQDRLPLAEMNSSALQYMIWTKAPGKEAIGRRLGVDGEQMNVYSYNTWMQNVEGISYDPTFPGATLEYKDATLPVKVTGQFFSPIIAHDLKTSATPGFYTVFTIRNTSDQAQEVSLAAYLRNPLASGGDPAFRGAAIRKLHTSVETDHETTYLTMRTAADTPFKSTLGTLCLSTSGGEPSWIAMDFGEYLTGRTLSIMPWNLRYETALRDFRRTGRLPKTGEQPCPTALGALTVGGLQQVNMQDMPKDIVQTRKDDIAKLSDEQVGEIIAQAKKLPSLLSIVEQAAAVDPSLLVPGKNGRELVNVFQQAVGQYAGEDGKASNWGDGMLCSSLTLKPGEERQIRMVLSWHFPNHLSPQKERNMGHMYSNWFKDAEEVNRFLTKNYDEFSSRVFAFQRVQRESNLPSELLASVAIQLNTLICSTWWTQEDQMGVWEGLGSVGQNTVDVAYQGSHPITSLFPEFEKNWTRLATAYQNKTSGRLYHTLPCDLTKGSTNNWWAYTDVNCHFALMLCRDYLWFGDKEYLKFYYPHVAQEIGVFDSLDSDGDGLPDQHTDSNTYDSWSMQGTPSYLSSIRIAALRAAIRMGEDMGDTQSVTKWKETLQRCLKSLDAKLWNGEYYSLWVNGPVRDDACMTDQLSGEMYTSLIGLGNALPPQRVRQVLSAIYKYNFSPEQGLYNGTYPPDHKPHMPTYRNAQGESNWTGIEYAAAAMMIDQGMVDQGMDVIKAVYRRYLRAGRYFNHEECGPHYYRPMSIWAAFLAATGFKVDAPRGILTIAPPIKDRELKAPWVSATGVGEFLRTGASFDLDCKDGQTTFRELRVNVPALKIVQVDGKPVAAVVVVENGLTVFRFSQPVSLKAGQTLTLR
jgi:uncharacterized protein (DUF608 family)